mmetsp:Transcript_8464/g.14213  ORF Transcript_8464/g.14213 Transcript_8464/m.14213 type:complete len:145 (-) Transcript_8464:66-500(-)|eukprot:CAMPEP_0168610964 /NCGR_PEP_ID=MMETSP0449_2-20121227/2086_1 /TAXON_ID=1082188 /ORGANISM="Strombidium rassoulzadegani, Strain ras09" /LENGTH=144 /DNA_ID=CAMNT_0008651341 /DNA_START=11 /DNA_END=445 /DNA_ORIENTATION=-
MKFSKIAAFAAACLVSDSQGYSVTGECNTGVLKAKELDLKSSLEKFSKYEFHDTARDLNKKFVVDDMNYVMKLFDTQCTLQAFSITCYDYTLKNTKRKKELLNKTLDTYGYGFLVVSNLKSDFKDFTTTWGKCYPGKDMILMQD